MPLHRKSSTQIKLNRALSERTLLQTRLITFKTTSALIHDEISQTRKDQRQAPWERYATFELKIQELESKLSAWEERIVDLEDRLLRLDEYCDELFAMEENEKEQYDCAIGTSVLLTFLFAYDGIILGLPQLNFWIYLVLPHTILALVVAAYIWKRGIFHTFPTAYILGFVALLVLAFLHQQTFLQNQRDWRGMTAMISHALHKEGILTIEPGQQSSGPNDTLTAIGTALRNSWHNSWQTLVNYTQHIHPRV